MSFERDVKYYPLFTQQAATGISIPVDTRDFKTAQVALVASGGAAFTIKVKASLQQEPPDFSKPSVPGNEWQYVQFVDLDTGNFADNLVFAGDDTKQIEINTNGITWFVLEVSAYTSGSLYAKATITTNL